MKYFKQTFENEIQCDRYCEIFYQYKRDKLLNEIIFDLKISIFSPRCPPDKSMCLPREALLVVWEPITYAKRFWNKFKKITNTTRVVKYRLSCDKWIGWVITAKFDTRYYIVSSNKIKGKETQMFKVRK